MKRYFFIEYDEGLLNYKDSKLINTKSKLFSYTVDLFPFSYIFSLLLFFYVQFFVFKADGKVRKSFQNISWKK